MNIYFCTWSDSPKNKMLALLKASAKIHNIKFKIIECHSLIEKQITLSKFLGALENDDILCCTDGFDVLYTTDASAIIKKFKELKSNLVFSGESLCSHHLPEVREYFSKIGKAKPYPFLCSGLIIGRVHTFRKMMKEIETWDKSAIEQRFKSSEVFIGNFNDQTLFD